MARNIWKYKNRTIKPGKSWRDDHKVLHPSNWNIWSAEYKASMEITEIIPETPPDSRLYNWSMDDDGKITSTAKALDDSGKVLGLKSILKNKVKEQQGVLLSQTDWVVIRKIDIDKEVPTNIKIWRDAIRVRSTEMENAIDATSSVDDIAKLWVIDKVDREGKTVKSGILYDWPKLES